MIQTRNGSANRDVLSKPGRIRAIRLGNAVLAPNCHSHICAFFSSPDEEYRVLPPFILDGLAEGEKAFDALNPQRRKTHLRPSMVIIGGMLQENPFFVPPDEFLLEPRKRRSRPMETTSNSDRN